MTKLERLTRKAIREWCKKNVKSGDVVSIHHVHPRAYVLSKAAAKCLFITTPLCDANSNIQVTTRVMGADGGKTVHEFCGSLKAGDWCSCAYVVLSHGSQQTIAIPCVTTKQGKQGKDV